MKRGPADGDKLPAALESNISDHAATWLRATLGNIPVGGALVTELVGMIIPNLREERVVRYLARLGEKLSATNAELEALRSRLDVEKVALLEDGASGAARATSDERIEQLATMVAAGLVGSSRDAEDQRAVVRMLNDMTEADLRYLMLLTKTYGDDGEWRKRNGFDWRWEERDGQHVSVGDQMDNVVEMYVQGRLIAAGLMERRLSIVKDHLDEPRIEEETEIAQQGIDLLRRMALLGPQAQ
ncbi:hypothetical protein [Caulobacter sp. LARHSG274]